VLAEQGYVVGVDISSGGERAVLADLHGKVHARDAQLGLDGTLKAPDDVVNRVTVMVRGLLDRSGVKPREVLRTGVGFAGPVDARQGTVRLAHDSPGWESFPLASRLESALDVPTLLDNDARLAALGEMWFGAGSGDPECNLVYVHWSIGVGGGIIAGGKLLRGSTTTAGEIGHMMVYTAGEDALPCRCGGKGHLEAYVRAPALVERIVGAGLKPAAARGEEAPASSTWTVPTIFEQAEHDPQVAQFVEEVVDRIAFTVANLITSINPALVVIGGRVAREGSRCIPRIAELARAYAMPLSAQAVEIVPAALGEESGVMGAVALGLDSLR
jgi:glucokinase